MHTTLFGFLDITCVAGSRSQLLRSEIVRVSNCECACSLACIDSQLLQLINRLEVLDLFSLCLLLLLSAVKARARQAASGAKQLADMSWKRWSMKARLGAYCTACSASVAIGPDYAEAVQRGEIESRSQTQVQSS